MAKDAGGHGSESRGAADALSQNHPKSVAPVVHPAMSGYYWHSHFSGPIPVKVLNVFKSPDYANTTRATVQVTARSNRTYPKGTQTEVNAHEVFRKGSLHVARGSGRYWSAGPTAVHDWGK